MEECEKMMETERDLRLSDRISAGSLMSPSRLAHRRKGAFLNRKRPGCVRNPADCFVTGNAWLAGLRTHALRVDVLIGRGYDVSG